MLSNFQFGDQALLQSFLVGQPELRTMMQRPAMQQLRQRVIASYHLGPLDASETQAYIEHRLRHVGWNEDPRFTPACFPLIHGLTGGIPRRINALCNRLLLASFLNEAHVVDVADVHAIAREMREEIGAGGAVSPMHQEPAAGGDHRIATHEAALRRIEDRMDRVERTVGATVDLLHNLLHPEKAGQGPGQG